MPTFPGNLPVHPLVVHAVVVLVPLAILGAHTVVVWPAAHAASRRRRSADLRGAMTRAQQRHLAPVAVARPISGV
jgi:hypothetical protein